MNAARLLPSRPLRAFAILAWAALSVAACNNSSGSGSGGAPGTGQGTPPPPPPPAPSANANACAGGGDTIHDAVSAPFFPKDVGGWCIRGDATAYGDKAKAPIDHLSEAIDGQCDDYQQRNVTRYVALRYLDGSGKPNNVNVVLSTYPDAAHAYSMFTNRVIAGGDPLALTAKPLSGAGTVASIGGGNANVWKGQYLLELTFNTDDPNVTPAQIVSASQDAIPKIASAIADKLPGGTDLVPAAKALPTAGLIPLGVDYQLKDALDFKGLANAAIGYYNDGGKRWRMIAVVGDAAAQATAAMAAVKAGGKPEAVAGVGDDATAVSTDNAAYVFARKGNVVYGVGDETFAAAPDAKLSKDDKVAKLKAWLSAPPPAAAPSASAAPKKK